MAGEAMTTTHGRSAVPVQRGPFVAADVRFVVRTSDVELAAGVDDDLRDLVGGSVDSDPRVYEAERSGPVWLSNGWTLRRDDEVLSTELDRRFITQAIVRDVNARITPRRDVVSVAASVVTRNGSSVVVVEAPDAAPTGRPIGWSVADLVVALLRGEWALVSHARAMLRLGGETIVAEPFWRPFELTASMAERYPIAGRHLIPASLVGALTGATSCMTVVVVEPGDAQSSTALRPITPAVALRDLAGQLLAPEGARRAAFRQLASSVERLSAFRLTVDATDLGPACREIDSVPKVANR